MKTQSLETYFTILAAIEDNLVEFHQIKEQLIQIVQDIKALANADELSDDDIFEFSTMATGGRHTIYIDNHVWHSQDQISGFRSHETYLKLIEQPNRFHAIYET